MSAATERLQYVSEHVTRHRPVAPNAAVYLELSRAGNVVFSLLLLVIGVYVAGGAITNPVVFFAAVATVGTAAGANALNDYFDIEVDALNKPDRPIPSGAVTPEQALLFSLLLFATAGVAAIWLPTLAAMLVLVNILAGIAYTPLFKPLPAAGNALIAYLFPSYLLLGGLIAGDVWTAAVLFGLAALATFAREVIKDVEDMAGDATNGLRTLPIVIGRRPAIVVALATIALAVTASLVPYLEGTFGAAYVVLVVPANVLMFASTAYALREPQMSQQWLKIGMFIAALAFVAGRAGLAL